MIDPNKHTYIHRVSHEKDTLGDAAPAQLASSIFDWIVRGVDIIKCLGIKAQGSVVIILHQLLCIGVLNITMRRLIYLVSSQTMLL